MTEPVCQRRAPPRPPARRRHHRAPTRPAVRLVRQRARALRTGRTARPPRADPCLRVGPAGSRMSGTPNRRFSLEQHRAQSGPSHRRPEGADVRLDHRGPSRRPGSGRGFAWSDGEPGHRRAALPGTRVARCTTRRTPGSGVRRSRTTPSRVRPDGTESRAARGPRSGSVSLRRASPRITMSLPDTCLAAHGGPTGAGRGARRQD